MTTMEQNRRTTAHRSTPSPYLYDVDPGLHASQKPSEVPRVKRNLVQSLVDKFNEEAKQRELCRHHSVDDSLITDHRSPPSGVIEANVDNAPNHNHPFSYTTTTSSNDRKSVRNGVLAGQRSRSDYNIGPNRKQQQQQQHQQRPSEVIYAHVMVNGGGGGGAGADKSRRTKTTVHSKEPNRMADDSSRGFAKSTGSLNMSAHEEQDELDADRNRQQLKNGNYYRYAEVDENIHRGGGRRSGSGSGGVGVIVVDGRRKTLDPIADNRLDVGIKKKSDDTGGAYETRNVERWSENEVKPHSRKFTEHEYVHEVSVSRDKNNKTSPLPPLASSAMPIPIMPIPKEDYPTSRERISRINREHKSESENEKKWYSLHRNGDTKDRRTDRWDDWSRLAASDSGAKHGSDLKRYYFGESPSEEAPEKPPRQKWRHEVLQDGGHRHRRNSEESAASSGVGLLSSKLVKKANERFGGIFDEVDHVPRSLYPSRRRRVSEGDSDVFPPASNRHWMSKQFDDDDHGPVEYDGLIGNGFAEESRKVIRREEKHTRHQRTRTTTRHQSPHDDIDADRHVVPAISPKFTKRDVQRQNGAARSTQRHDELIVPRRQHVERQTKIHEQSSSASRRHHHHRHHVHRDGSSDATEDKMETSESEQPLYGGSQESRMSLGSRLSSADEEPAAVVVDNVHTPQSVVRQMDKRQINYENSQHHRREVTSTQGNKSNGGRRFWFERSTDEDARNNNNNNNSSNNEWTSATLSRLETNKNHRNGAADHRRWASNTIDRNDVRQHRDRHHNGHEIRIQINDEDAPPATVLGGRSSSSYHSENESQVSGGSSGTQKSPGAKTKRVNFKSKSANLSPVHREALLRSASPARAPSVTGSMKSNESDVSHVIQHATAVADIPPAREYRLRSANTSPSPPASSIGSNSKKESRVVHRSFSLLAPWKPRKYREKYESSPSSSSMSKRSAKNGSAPNLLQDRRDVGGGGGLEPRNTSAGGSPQVHFKKRSVDGIDGRDGGTSAVQSRESSSEKLDSLSPLPSESAAKSKKKSVGSNKKKSGLLRRHSMPKDSRFANFFRRKKDKEAKK